MLNNPSSGNAPALPAVTRRTLLRAAPAFGLPLLPAAALATPVAPDPLPALLAARERARLHWLAMSDAHGEDSPEEKAAWDAFAASEAVMETTVATTPEGVAAQIEYMKRSYDGGSLEAQADPKAFDVPFAFLDVILEGLGRIAR